MRYVESKVQTRDGRSLSVMQAGLPEGDAVFFLHGTPGVLEMYGPSVEEGVRRGLRFVNYLRPGYGKSDRQLGRSVASCAVDVEAVADALGIGRFYVVGESGGGPHALACAALLLDRVRAVALIAGVAPPDAENWEQGMAEGNLQELKAWRRGPRVLQKHIEKEIRALRSVETLAQLRAALDKYLCDADRAAIDGEFGRFLLSAWKIIGKYEIGGWLDDDDALFGDWGFRLEQVAAPVGAWQGSDDRMVPAKHGSWLAEKLPNAELHLLPHEGHISLVAHLGAVLDALIAAER
jgi:pimeloyl-ACP methyl ester carboxylesterase